MGGSNSYIAYGYLIRNSVLTDDEIVYDVRFPDNIISPTEPSNIFGYQMIKNTGCYEWNFSFDKMLTFGGD